MRGLRVCMVASGTLSSLWADQSYSLLLFYIFHVWAPDLGSRAESGAAADTDLVTKGRCAILALLLCSGVLPWLMGEAQTTQGRP